jgi:1,4-dihydroxy-2-naphthoate octaprenyltransferase
LPVYLFALSEASKIDWSAAALVFVILHLLVYPSSNGYNSYMDKDQSPIGGLASPLQPTRQLFHVTMLMDLLAISLSFFIGWKFCLGILLYILASRCYSYRGIRLKKYPVLGFLTVFICQGALIFFISYHAINPAGAKEAPLLSCFISSFLIGALYPLTQVYQHEADKKDGIVTISMLLGKRGSFLFSMALFLLATLFLYLRFHKQNNQYFILFLLVMLPVVLFFLHWMVKVWKNGKNADFRNSLRMNILSTLCTTAYFITLIILKH